ncbi:MAG: hypothetical protein C0501_05465 [Isosphaera sp.]|nr:hypothetical protein [Isosphaera sp.]
MPRGSWLGIVVGVAAVASPAASLGADVPAAPPGAPAALPGGPPAHVGPPVHNGAHGEVKDLTPPGFADLHPPPDKHHGGHHVPGHLAPTVPEHSGFYAQAEYTLFRPRSGGFDYTLINGTGLATAGGLEALKYDRGNGLRVEGGYRFGAGWDGGFVYSYLKADGRNSVLAGPGQVLLPTLTRPGLTDAATSASAFSDLTYNTYDLLLGKRFLVDEHTALRGLAGFRFAEVRQRFEVRYDGLDAVGAVVTNRNQFEGFGPFVGGEGVVGGWHGLHGYVRTFGGLLTGRSMNALLETNNNGGTTLVDNRFGFRKVVPFGSVAVGAGWQYRTVSLRAGYEIVHYWGLTEPVRFTDTVSQGKLVTRPSDLSLEGFFVQAGFAF